MTPDEVKQYAQEQGERFWRDAGMHWLNDDLGLLPNSQVVEVGGYLGDWTDYVQRKYECFVTVYEPVKEFAEHLRRRFSNRPKITVHEAAVEAQSGTGRIAVMGEGSSMYNGGFQSGPVIEVVDAAQLTPLGLLAINAEGAEYPILDRLIASGEIKNVFKLLVQFHAFLPDAFEHRMEIRRKLADTHNEVFSYPFCWEGWVRK